MLYIYIYIYAIHIYIYISCAPGSSPCRLAALIAPFRSGAVSGPRRSVGRLPLITKPRHIRSDSSDKLGASIGDSNNTVGIPIIPIPANGPASPCVFRRRRSRAKLMRPFFHNEDSGNFHRESGRTLN